MKLLRTGKVSERLGICKPTLLKKIKSGTIRAYRIGKECRIPESEIRRFLEGKISNCAVIHARVLSYDQKEDLMRQIEYLKQYAASRGFQIAKIITDILSGLCENRRGLKHLFEIVEGEKVGRVI